MWFSELFQLGVYKRSQGRIVRQVTFAALAIVFALVAWRMYVMFGPRLGLATIYSLAGAVVALGGWISYRLVNMPRFADFLIAVEAEMNKVSWPSRQELIRSSLVVIVVMFAMAGVLYAFDILWAWLFVQTGILRS
jgi:preprotein translocase subunit SecE